MRLIPLMLIGFASLTWAQLPYINYRGIVNAARYMPPGSPSGAVARGSVISIFGSNLGPATSPTLAFPLQTTLGNVSVSLTQGSTKVNGIPIFVSPGQINAIVPSTAPLGSVAVNVVFNGARSNPAPVVITDTSFGIYSVAAGRGPGILQNYVSAASQPVNSLTASAQPNQTITLWGTGLGPVTYADNIAPSAGNLPVQTEVFVGGISAKVAYDGRSPCCSGTDQIVFQVPPNAPSGCWVPVYVRTGGKAISNFVTMAITPDGSPCAEPGNAMAGALINGTSQARVIAARIAVHHDIGTATVNDAITDLFGAYTAKEASLPFNFDPNVSLPPAGTCTSYAFSGDFTQNTGFPPGLGPPSPTGQALGAGALTISGGAASAKASSGAYLTAIGGAIPTIAGATNTLLLNPGNFSVSGTAGADVGSFQAQLAIPSPLNWTNRDQLSAVARNQGMMVAWSGAAPGNNVFISGAGADLPANASYVFVCAAPPGATSFTVPADVLANMPPVRNRLIQSRGVVYVGQWPIANPAGFTASGVNTGLVLPVEVSGRTVEFQ